jgi:EAL domain-containing protein (putative c-di-GMP-specific phosphodiesterase class I)/GGDEF domain-containing protein
MAPENLLSRIARFEDNASENAPGGVILVELDRFRQLRGQVGFRQLFGLVRQVRAALVEVLGEQGEIHRFGLSRFIVLIPETGSDELQQFASDLFGRLSRRTFEMGDEAMAISLSMALARFDHRFAGVDRMLVAMCERLEKVVAEGGNELTFVEPGVSATLALDSEDHMLGLLMQALHHDRLKVVFQPLLATRPDEQLRSFQMLPRLKASDGALIPAAEFIPVARAARLLPVLDRWMLTHAVKLLRGQLKTQHVRLFINQSDALLAEADRLDWVLETLGKAENRAGAIVLELRIDDAMSHLKHTARLLNGVREHGAAVCFSMVDEHSRWDLLGGDLSCDYLRMSPGFVSRLSSEPDLEQRFLRVSEAVRNSHTRIIMPMIEDEQTAASMWRTGADFMQGNMIQEPEDSIALEE